MERCRFERVAYEERNETPPVNSLTSVFLPVSAFEEEGIAYRSRVLSSVRLPLSIP